MAKGRIEDVLMFQDSIHETPLVVVLGVAAGLGAGIATQKAVKEIGFPSNDEYEQQIGIIKESESAIVTLQNAAGILDEQGLPEKAASNRASAEAHEVTITEARANMPDDYNPHLEGAVSVSSGLAVAAGIVYASYRYWRNHR